MPIQNGRAILSFLLFSFILLTPPLIFATSISASDLDPISLDLSLVLGGSGNDSPAGVVLDSQGNIILVTTSDSEDIQTTENVFQSSSSGGFDCVVLKLNPDGEIIFTSYLGGSDDEGARAINVDLEDNIIIAGFTKSEDFPVTVDASQDVYAGGSRDGDAFIAKISSNGQSILWATYYGGNGDEHLTNMAIDSLDNVIVTGRTSSSNLSTTPNAFQANLSGTDDAFVAKISASGNSLLYSSYLGGSDVDSGAGVALDSSDNAILVGLTASTDFPTNASCYQPNHGGGENDAYITKIDLDLGIIRWSTFLGENGDDLGVRVDVDEQDRVVLVGFTDSINFPVQFDAFQVTHGGDIDAFVSKISADGKALLFSSFFGGSNMELGSAVTVTPEGDIFVTGRSYSNNMPVNRAYQSERAGGQDAFLFKIDGSNHTIEFSTYIGGTLSDAGWNLVIDTNGRPIVFGWTESSNFPSNDSFNGGTSDVFLCRFSTSDVIPIDTSIQLILLVSGIAILIAVIILYKKR